MPPAAVDAPSYNPVMSMACSVCAHPQRELIDSLLIEASPIRPLASRFDLVTTSLRRHKANHLPAALAKSKAAEEAARADNLLAELKALRGKAVALLLAAEKAGDYRTALAGVREARACIETLLEVEGELSRRPTVNIAINAEWLSLQTLILTTLEPYPDARRELVSALEHHVR